MDLKRIRTILDYTFQDLVYGMPINPHRLQLAERGYVELTPAELSQWSEFLCGSPSYEQLNDKMYVELIKIRRRTGRAPDYRGLEGRRLRQAKLSQNRTLLE